MSSSTAHQLNKTGNPSLSTATERVVLLICYLSSALDFPFKSKMVHNNCTFRVDAKRWSKSNPQTFDLNYHSQERRPLGCKETETTYSRTQRWHGGQGSPKVPCLLSALNQHISLPEHIHRSLCLLKDRQKDRPRPRPSESQSHVMLSSCVCVY